MPFTEDKGTNRYNFWGSFVAKPKPKHKFLLRFGNNALFRDGEDYDLDLRSPAFKTLGLGGVPLFGNTSWLVKSVSRPTFDGMNLKGLRDATGKVVSFEMPKPDDIKWQPMSIKMVNASSHTFWPSEMLNDLDWLLGMVVDKSGYRYDAEQRRIVFGYDNNVAAGTFAQPVSQRMAQNRLLFEPLQIIDLSTDYFSDSVTLLYSGEETAKKYRESIKEDIQLKTWSDPYGTFIPNKEIGLYQGSEERYNPLADQEVFPVGVWDIRDPYLISISFGDNNYENDNAFIEYEMKIGYQWAVYTSYNTDDPKTRDVLAKG